MSDLSQAQRDELVSICNQICTPGGGIIACDETPMAMEGRFKGLDIENTLENRNLYRDIVFSSPKSSLAGLNAVILNKETLPARTSSGKLLIEVIKDLGIVPGVCVDLGHKALPGSPEEVFTQGLDDLDTRCAEFKKAGCQFAKWRVPLTIDTRKGFPSRGAIEQGALGLAMYASICQRNGLVPIVEPDINRSGDHDLETCRKVTEEALAKTYMALTDYGVFLEGTLLKPNMVTSGAQCPIQASPLQVGLATRQALSRTVPAAVPGIFFLSGGQTEEEASRNLSGVNAPGNAPAAPWYISFCYGRALQDSARKAWNGKPENVAAAQAELAKMIKNNQEALTGQYSTEPL